jgi:hypothetical protein
VLPAPSVVFQRLVFQRLFTALGKTTFVGGLRPFTDLVICSEFTGNHYYYEKYDCLSLQSEFYDFYWVVYGHTLFDRSVLSKGTLTEDIMNFMSSYYALNLVDYGGN